MSSGPSKLAEAVVAMVVPPGCREEVLGDLHERFTSPWQYSVDAVLTVPLVILSRMRRIADPQILVIQAFGLYMSFLGATWLGEGAVPRAPWLLLRIAIPAALAMLGMILDDTYASRVGRSWLNVARGPVFGLLLALACEALLWIANPDLALAPRITFYGCALSLLLSCVVRMMFPPVTGRPASR